MGTKADPRVVQAAAEWLMRLKEPVPGGPEDKALRAAFERWRGAHPDHQRAVDELRPLLDRLDRWRTASAGERRAAQRVLRPGRRRSTAKAAGAGVTLVLALWGAGVAWWATQGLPPSALLADVRTPVAGTKNTTLADGSRVRMGSATALSFDGSGGRRTLRLHGGDILVEVAPDPARPFTVLTPHGSVTALGTRFLLRERAEGTELVMLESRTRVTPVQSRASTEVAAGERVRLMAERVQVLPGIDAAAEQASFESQRLVVHDWPLLRVLDELGRHRPGVLRGDVRSLEGMHFSGVLPLDDTDRALQLMATSLPRLRVRTLTPWLVQVDAPVAPAPQGD